METLLCGYMVNGDFLSHTLAYFFKGLNGETRHLHLKSSTPSSSLPPLTVTDLKKKKIASFVWLLHMGGVQPEKYMMFNVTCHQERSIMGRYNCVRIQLKIRALKM